MPVGYRGHSVSVSRSSRSVDMYTVTEQNHGPQQLGWSHKEQEGTGSLWNVFISVSMSGGVYYEGVSYLTFY